MHSPESVALVPAPELERLAVTLRAMPQVGPEESSWEAISARLAAAPLPARTRPSTRSWFAFAAAASVAVASAWLGIVQQDDDLISDATRVATAQTAVTGTPGPGASAHDALVARSGTLERWLIESGSEQWPQDFGSASASVEIENLIAHVDQRLTRSSSEAEREQLWQRRVTLLEQLVNLQGEQLAFSVPASDGPRLL